MTDDELDPDLEDVVAEERVEELDSEPEARSGADYAPSVAERLAFYQRAGGIVTPILTALLAFFVGGLVVLATTGKNPLATYRAIFDGTGLNWLFPWVSGTERSLAALNLQQTLLIATPLIAAPLPSRNISDSRPCTDWTRGNVRPHEQGRDEPAVAMSPFA